MARLAVTGPSKAGKSTLVDYLVRERGYILLNYTDHLKYLAAKALTAAGCPTNTDAILRDKEDYRPFLIALSHQLGFDGGYGVEAVLDAHRDSGGNLPENCVFDCVRFTSQYAKLYAEGFVLVRLVVDETTRHLRGATAPDIDTQVAYQPDEILLNGAWDFHHLTWLLNLMLDKRGL